MFTCMISACLVMGCSKNVVTENPAAAPDVENTVVTPTPETPDAPVDTPTTPVVVPDVYSEQDD